MALSLNDINIRNSWTWIRCNDDAKSSTFRNLFIQKYGGKFIKNDKFWEWTPLEIHLIANIDASQPNESVIQPKTWIFNDPENNIIKVQNILDFCKKFNLSRSSVYEVISGRRKSHKGFSLVEIINDDTKTPS